MHKLSSNRNGLGYDNSNFHDVRTSKTIFVHATNKAQRVGNLIGQRRMFSNRNQFLESRRFGHKFIPTCFNYNELGHTRPRCNKLVKK